MVRITHDDVARLAALEHPEGIVSVYLNIDPRLMHDRLQPLQQFKGAVRRFWNRERDERWRRALERERDRIQRFLEGYEPRGRGLALFACAPAGLWEVLPLDVPVPSVVHVHTTTDTALLTRILDEYERIVVAVVQRDRARIYVSEQRQAEPVDDIETDVPGRHDQGGWAQARFQRHIEFHVLEHLKKVADEIERLYYTPGFQRLVVGGPEETVAEFLKLLPDPVARTVIGTFHVDLKHENDAEILRHARRVAEDYERRSEEELVRRIAEAAGSNGRGVLGLEPTLDAVLQGRVQTLVVADGISHEGSACTGCGFFAGRNFDRCPLCGADAERAADIVERAVERAYLGGAHIEMVYGKARELLLAQGDGLGALLRY